MKSFFIPILLVFATFSPIFLIDKVVEREVSPSAPPATGSTTTEALLKPEKKLGPLVIGALRTVEDSVEQVLHLHSKKNEGQNQSTQPSLNKGIVKVESSSAWSF